MIEGPVIARRPCRYSGLSVTRPLTIKLLFDELSGRYLQIPAPFFYGGSSAFPPDRQGGLKPGRGNVVDRRFVTFLCAVRAVPEFYDIFSMAFRCLSVFCPGFRSLPDSSVMLCSVWSSEPDFSSFNY